MNKIDLPHIKPFSGKFYILYGKEMNKVYNRCDTSFRSIRTTKLNRKHRQNKNNKPVKHWKVTNEESRYPFLNF